MEERRSYFTLAGGSEVGPHPSRAKVWNKAQMKNAMLNTWEERYCIEA